MTREEQLQQAADAYASQMCKNCSARLYCDERNKKCVERREQAKVFVDGAKWAEECLNLSSLWHDASEYPSKSGVILYQTTLGQFRTVCNDKSGEGAWKVFAMDYDVARWAYVSDLFPKGGEG